MQISNPVSEATAWLSRQRGVGGSHAKLSPSSAHRWATCPGSVALNRFVPRKPSGEAAKLGTFLHAVAEYTLRRKLVDRSFEVANILGCTDGEYVLDNDGATKVYTYSEFVYSLVDLGGKVAIEVALDLEPITGERNARGTADCVVKLDNKFYVIDLKTGRIPVEAEGNMQLNMYALAAYLMDEKGVMPWANP